MSSKERAVPAEAYLSDPDGKARMRDAVDGEIRGGVESALEEYRPGRQALPACLLRSHCASSAVR